MNKPAYKSDDELPLTLSALNVAAVLGISRAGASASWSTAKAGFPTLNIGSRILIPKYKFLAWIDGSSSKKG